jgi:hypothetical protein
MAGSALVGRTAAVGAGGRGMGRTGPSPALRRSPSGPIPLSLSLSIAVHPGPSLPSRYLPGGPSLLRSALSRALSLPRPPSPPHTLSPLPPGWSGEEKEAHAPLYASALVSLHACMQANESAEASRVRESMRRPAHSLSLSARPSAGCGRRAQWGGGTGESGGHSLSLCGAPAARRARGRGASWLRPRHRPRAVSARCPRAERSQGIVIRVIRVLGFNN